MRPRHLNDSEKGAGEQPPHADRQGENRAPEPFRWLLADRCARGVPRPRAARGGGGRSPGAASSPEAAQAAAGWNRRRREPYPEDYERTLAEHAAWKAEQVNAAVQEKIERATEEGTRVADRIDDDPEYLQGFAAGVERARDKYLSDDCESLLDGSFNSFSGSPPGGKDRDWERGYEDGQRLVYSLELLRRLPRCFVPVPPPAP